MSAAATEPAAEDGAESRRPGFEGSCSLYVNRGSQVGMSGPALEAGVSATRPRDTEIPRSTGPEALLNPRLSVLKPICWGATMSIQRMTGIVLLVVGIAVLIFGLNASHSIVDRVSNAFTGRFTETTTWYIIGGAAAGLLGLLLVASGGGRNRG